jgi:hypothetical protein
MAHRSCLHIVVLILATALPVSAQPWAVDGTIRFRQLDVMNLSFDLTVDGIFQDDIGFLWFGTEDGLLRVDGYDVRAYRPVPFDTTSVSDPWVNSFSGAGPSAFWVATWTPISCTADFYDKTPPAASAVDFSGRIVVAFNVPFNPSSQTGFVIVSRLDPATSHVSAPENFNADLHTSDSDIGVGRLTGDVRMTTSDGDVTVGSLSGANLALTTSDGDIRVEEFDGESIEIGSSDGDLLLGRLTAGRITARTSDGDIRISSLNGSAEVRTSDGDILITLPANYGANIRLRGDDVRIARDLQFEGELDEDGERATGALNGGGPMIDARTSDGDVTIRGN